MSKKRVTIYDLGRELDLSPSYISKALNNHPSISQRIRDLVRNKADELQYSQNSRAANLRLGSSRTIGVIVPHINKSFFSEAISGIEEACFGHDHSLIICQSHESFDKECKAVDTLIRQNVDCILISVSAETTSVKHLQAILNNHIGLIQFDRCMDGLNGYAVINNEEDIAMQVTEAFLRRGYSRIAFIGGPSYLNNFRHRKQGYLKALRSAGIALPKNFILDDALSREKAEAYATRLLKKRDRPDAFLTVSDHQALGVLAAAQQLGIAVPEQLGIAGFANEDFTAIITPSLSSVDQHAKEMGRTAANIYFDHILRNKAKKKIRKEVLIRAEFLARQSLRDR
jgi:LacI family transcriptional regulator